MRIRKIRAGLEKLMPALKAWGADSIGNDLAKLTRLMADYDDLTVSEFCTKARRGLDAPQQPSETSASEQVETVVKFYVDLLRETEFDDKAFNNAVTRLRDDRKVRFKELSEIAKQFNGYELRFKNKSSALTEITTKRNADRRTEHKFKMLAEW